MKRNGFFLLILLLVLSVPLSAYAGMLEDLPIKQDATGENIVILQQRLIDLGYLHFRATGSFGDMTKAAVKSFQKRNNFSSTGEVDTETYFALFSRSVTRAAAGSITRISGPITVANPPEYGKLVSWSQITSLFPVGAEAEVTDLYTEHTYKIMRTGGTNHADVQTVGDSSFQTFLKSFGGSCTWEKRPVLVEIGGVNYAASIFGSPNANDYSSSSAMEGSVCLYFYESTSDIGGIADAEHVTNVYLASAQAGATK